MIRARFASDVATLARSLASRASELAKARAEERLAETRADPWRWRKAHLLWPLFTKD